MLSSMLMMGKKVNISRLTMGLWLIVALMVIALLPLTLWKVMGVLISGRLLMVTLSQWLAESICTVAVKSCPKHSCGMQ